MKTRFRSILAVAAFAPVALAAQQPMSSDSTPASAAATLPPIDFSGVLFGNFMYAGGQSAGAYNSFNLERSYLTFKMPAGDRASIRVTADVYNAGSGNGYALRAKYAYLNYTLVKSGDMKIDGRAGIIHTPVIDVEEGFWPRYIAKTAVEQAGYFSSADVGAASFITLPGKLGEAYVGVLNGTGYATTADNNRFKDYTGRLTLTPFKAGQTGLLGSFTVLGYYYKGANAGGFTGNAVDKDRYGLFAGVKQPNLTLGAEWDQNKDETETSATASTTNTGRLLSGFVNVKPFMLLSEGSFPVGVVVRFDRFKPNTSVDGYYNNVITGLTWDLTKKVALALDYQEMTPHSGLVASPSKAYYLHWVANF